MLEWLCAFLVPILSVLNYDWRERSGGEEIKAWLTKMEHQVEKTTWRRVPKGWSLQ